jgi:hypothetical protein
MGLSNTDATIGALALFAVIIFTVLKFSVFKKRKNMAPVQTDEKE